MRLLPRWRSEQAEEAAALQQRVHALQAALDSCKGVASTCRRYHYTTLTVAVVLALAAGFVLGVYLSEGERLGFDAAWPATRVTLKAVGASILIELAAGLLAAMVWVAGAVAT